jgi:hypothetical protein
MFEFSSYKMIYLQLLSDRALLMFEFSSYKMIYLQLLSGLYMVNLIFFFPIISSI